MKKRLDKARDQYDTAQGKFDSLRASKKKKEQADKVYLPFSLFLNNPYNIDLFLFCNMFV